MLAAVRRALERSGDIDVVAEVSDATRVVPVVGETRPDVVLLDIRMPQLDGLTCLERIKRLYPDVAVVMLSTFEDDAQIDAARARGASGYVVKTADPLRLATMIVEAVKSPDFLVFRPEPTESERGDREHDLSDRELTILRALAQGLTNKEIGRELWVSEQTVKFHLRNIYAKLGIRSRTEAVRYAITHGLASKRNSTVGT
jgi:DNA-binding NarL/FixJ family response regulator